MSVLLAIGILIFSVYRNIENFAIERLNLIYCEDNFEIVKVKSYNKFIFKSEKYEKEFNVSVRWGNTSESPMINLGWIMDTDYIKIVAEQDFARYKYDGYSFEMDNDGDILILINNFNCIDDISNVIKDLATFADNWKGSRYILTFDIGFKSDEETFKYIYDTEADTLMDRLDIGEMKKWYLDSLRRSGSPISEISPKFLKENAVERAYLVYFNDKKTKLSRYDYDTKVIEGELYFNVNRWFPYKLREIGYKIKEIKSPKYKFKINKDVYTFDDLNHGNYLKNDERINFIDCKSINNHTYISIQDMENILNCKIDFDADSGKINIQ